MEFFLVIIFAPYFIFVHRIVECQWLVDDMTSKVNEVPSFGVSGRSDIKGQIFSHFLRRKRSIDFLIIPMNIQKFFFYKSTSTKISLLWIFFEKLRKILINYFYQSFNVTHFSVQGTKFIRFQLCWLIESKLLYYDFLGWFNGGRKEKELVKGWGAKEGRRREKAGDERGEEGGEEGKEGMGLCRK